MASTGEVDQLVVRWDGFTGAPGYSVFYATGTGGARDHVYDFLDSVKGNIPAGVTLTVPLSGNTFDVATGTLTDVWTQASGSTVVTAVGGAPNVGNAGVCFTWRTATVVDGKKLRGRTFIVPLSTANYSSNGTLDDAVLGAFRTKGAALITAASPNFVIWHRPKGGTGGNTGAVTTCTISDRAAILRSRSV